MKLSRHKPKSFLERTGSSFSTLIDINKPITKSSCTTYIYLLTWGSSRVGPSMECWAATAGPCRLMQPRRRWPPRRRCRRLWLVQPPTLTYSVPLWSRLRKETLTTRELASAALRRWYHPRQPTRCRPIGRRTHVISGISATCWNSKEKDKYQRRQIYSLKLSEGNDLLTH